MLTQSPCSRPLMWYLKNSDICRENAAARNRLTYFIRCTGVGLVRLLKAGNKGLPQIVHVHAADGDAADALRLVGKILNIVAGGIVADEQVDGRAERPDQPVLGVGAHGVGAEGGVVRERKEPFAAPDARQRKGTGAGVLWTR